MTLFIVHEMGGDMYIRFTGRSVPGVHKCGMWSAKRMLQRSVKWDKPCSEQGLFIYRSRVRPCGGASGLGQHPGSRYGSANSGGWRHENATSIDLRDRKSTRLNSSH